MPKPRNNQPKSRGNDDVLVRVDNETAEQIKLISHEMGSSIKETTRWLTWLARKTLGRKIKIEDDKEILEISLKEFRKLTDLDHHKSGVTT